MTRKIAAPAPTLAEQAASLAFQIASGRTLLRSALIAGTNTASIRVELTDLEQQAGEIDHQLWADRNAARADQDARTAASADAAAQAAIDRIDALVVSLEPPQAPWGAP